jgi:glycine dehydrogenase subunit 1
MPFIPHTKQDMQEMLATIGAASLADLFDEIPAALQIKKLEHVPEGLNEMQVMRLMQQHAAQDHAGLCFIGAGAYEHHIPAAVWDIVSRGEFYTAYTPYQAEASQGTLQLLYEFQTMMAGLTGMDVSNASVYDGATALAESVLMAVRAQRDSKAKTILMPRTVNPYYRKVVKTICQQQGIALQEINFSAAGKIDITNLAKSQPEDFLAIIIPQPNFFGVLEDVDVLTNWAHQANALVIAVTNPMSLALLKAPRQWGQHGADIACGDAQPFGVPLSSGGPYVGFICCKKELVRQLPGRIVGRTVDAEGKPAFTLTLQAREQHIRRAKATSNICTNQSLLVTAVTIYLSLLGPEGLRRVAAASHNNAVELQNKLAKIPDVTAVFKSPIFHEFVIRLNQPVNEVIAQLADVGIQAGFALTQDYPELGECLLVCATETKLPEDLKLYCERLNGVITKNDLRMKQSKASEDTL